MSETAAKPFNERGRCSKCGGRNVMSKYQPPIEQDPLWYARKYEPVGKWPEEEFIKRTCQRCGYDWPETTQPSS